MGDSRLLRAARRLPVDRTPVWFMRQAGRFQAEYREIRKKHSMLEVCTNADLASEVTLLPLKLLPGLDGAIIFSDLLLPLQPMGIEIEYLPSEGPAIRNPVAHRDDVEKLRPVEPERDLKPVLDATRIVCRELGGRVPLIGFAGAPFTLASYVIEGGSSRHYLKTKGMMQGDPRTWDALLSKLADVAIRHLKAQAAAGAEIVQLFDSWVGVLAPEDYAEHVLRHSRRIFDELRAAGIPAIHFGTETTALLELMKRAGGDVIGIDWRVPLDVAWGRVGDTAIMGNLDPAALLGPREALERRVDWILARAANRPGHIFNLGHGILPETPVENVLAVIERVHARTER